MAHKVHPKIFRIGTTEKWDSVWFSNFKRKKYQSFLQEDLKIREFFEKRFSKEILEQIEIERAGERLNVIIKTPKPGVFIGRGGKGVEEILKKLRELLKKEDIKVDIQETSNISSNAKIVAKEIALALERRVPYRRAVKRAIKGILRDKKVEGIKIRVKGRLDGVEIARPETFRLGKFPLQTLRANIDYGEARAYCSYGVVGIKVWIYKGQKLS